MSIELYNDGEHVCMMFSDLVDDNAAAVQANQFLIVSNGEGALIDPSGNMTFNGLIVGMGKFFHHKNLKYILASHQDPDIVGSLNKWMMSTDADLYVSSLWSRFVPHFCTGDKTAGRIVGIPDGGMRIKLGKDEIVAVPAHFLHAEGNFQFYDPRSRILFSGDMGASLVHHHTVTQPIVTPAEVREHIQHMQGFHQRYMVSSKVCRYWVNMVKEMDIHAIVPQHGRWFQGKPAVHAFLDWIATLDCGIDRFDQSNYTMPR
jgi:flavorubredoxin